MTMTYIEWLRARLGRRKIIVAYATAVIRNAAGWVLCQRRTDFGTAWWGLPGGVLEIGETLAECAMREAYEETGLQVQTVRLVGLYSGPQYDVRYPNGDEVQQWTAAIECRPIGGHVCPDGAEVSEVKFFPPDDLPPQPVWYADMVRDLNAATATFETPRPSPPDNQGNYIHQLRALLGQERLIVPGAVACIRNAAGQVLLTHRRDNGRWHLPAGFMDLGESAAETVVREVREELGLIVEPLRLLGVYSGPEDQVTYPNGDQVQNCSAFFDCRVVGGELHPDGVEIAAARYFPLDELPDSLVARWRRRLLQANLPAAEAAFS